MLDLKSGYPWWAVRNGLMRDFPPLRTDAVADVAIIGGGITAALIADELVEHGHSVVVIEQRDIGWGSTAASTALLQYEIDTHMTELAQRYGLDDAWLAYGQCARSLELLQGVADGLDDTDFQWQDSLYYASRPRDRASLLAEFKLRHQHGLEVEWLEADALLVRYGIRAPGAILSHQAARVDPYRMANLLFARLQARGMAIHDRTRIEKIEAGTHGVLLHTGTGHAISASRLVMAAGYANETWLDKRVARNRSSYAFISDTLTADQLGPLRNTLIWESARPYLYARSTGDGRILVGGEDDSVDIPARRDARVLRKAEILRKKFGKVLDEIPLEPAFSWAGTFAETADGLPFFGAHPQHGDRVLFAMAYGGNGITYSMLGAGLIRALIEEQPHPLQGLFSFARLERM
jgi:glycine/D-amino acid oxidase-like deaminating enzyme